MKSTRRILFLGNTGVVVKEWILLIVLEVL